MTTADLQLAEIAERIERAAWWPGHTLREDWKLGDYSVYALTFPAPGFKALHIRFVSEPDAAAMLDVSASNEDPVFRTAAPATASACWSNRARTARRSRRRSPAS